MSDTLVNVGVDSLTPTSRALYERTYAKTVLSIVYAAFALMYLGFCSEAGGKSASAANLLNNSVNDDSHFSQSQSALTGGYGFASFCYFTAFTLSLSAAIIISPLLQGSPQENKILKSPSTFETTV